TITAYAPYDRWCDTFNASTEFVAAQQARSLATTAFLWSFFSDATKPWQSQSASIAGPGTVEAHEEATFAFNAPGINLDGAQIIWEARNHEPFLGHTFTLLPTNAGPHWVEAEALLPDGRRLFATNTFTVPFPIYAAPNAYHSSPWNAQPAMTALYHLDGDEQEASGKQGPVELLNGARFDSSNVGWMAARYGSALRFDEIGDRALIRIANNTLHDAATEAIVLECMLYITDYLYAPTNLPMITFYRNWNASLEFLKNPYLGLMFRGGTQFETSGNTVSNALPRNQWHHLRLAIGKTGYSVRINGNLLAFHPSSELANWGSTTGFSTLSIGNFEGWIDEVVVWNLKTNRTVTLSASPVGNHIQLNLSGVLGTHYLLQNSSNLLHWSTISTNHLTANPTDFFFSIHPGQQFYRTTWIP
ncbi:MAG: hypothetical protein ACK4UN_10815, partial [Limisphaerales bacterium]